MHPALGAAANYDFCLTCHGADANGNPAIHAPKLAGMEPWYLKSQLEAFQAGWRGVHPADAAGNEMRPVGGAPRCERHGRSSHLHRHAEAEGPAAHCHGQCRAWQAALFDLRRLPRRCGEGNDEYPAPALAKRTDWYLLTQLKNFRDGLRGANPDDTRGMQMRAIMSTLPDDAAMNDVVAYINTLR